MFKIGLWAAIENYINEKKRLIAQPGGCSRDGELQGIFYDCICIPWSNCLYAPGTALGVRPYALQKHKTVPCYLLIREKALITLSEEKNKSKWG